jgi:hypothetical protein
MSVSVSRSTRASKANIIWSEEKEISLLKIIHQMNAHIKSKKFGVVTTSFVEKYPEYNIMLDDKKNAQRRLRKKFNSLKLECIKLLESGNRSAYLTFPRSTSLFTY